MTTSNEIREQAAANLVKEVDALAKATLQFHTGKIGAYPFGVARGEHLGKALQYLAACHGVTLEGPLHIDSRGEFSIVALPADGSSPKLGCGPYGEAFAAILNQHHPRQGINPGTVLPESGWCRMNHFEVERMVLAQAQAMLPACPA